MRTLTGAVPRGSGSNTIGSTITAASTSATAPTRRRRPRRFSVSTSCCFLQPCHHFADGEERAEHDDLIILARALPRRRQAPFRRVDAVPSRRGLQVPRRAPRRAAPRGPGSDARCQRVMRGASARSTPPMSLSRSMPHTAIVSGAKPEAREVVGEHRAPPAALCATSRIDLRPARQHLEARRAAHLARGRAGRPASRPAAVAQRVERAQRRRRIAQLIAPRSAGCASPPRLPPGPQ